MTPEDIMWNDRYIEHLPTNKDFSNILSSKEKIYALCQELNIEDTPTQANLVSTYKLLLFHWLKEDSEELNYINEILNSI